MLQPSLSGDARISVICTLNPDVNAVAESTSTLLFAQRIKKVQLNAKKKEVVDTDALLERYRQEIEELKKRLSEKEKEAEAPGRTRRLSAREVILHCHRPKPPLTGVHSNLSSRARRLARTAGTSRVQRVPPKLTLI